MNAHWSTLADHLWQSTLFALAAGLLTLALRKNRARARHWIWLAASCKFLIPLSLLIALGSHIEWRTIPKAAPSNISAVMGQVSQPFTAPRGSARSFAAVPPAANPLPAILLSIWACGVLGISCSWWIRWRRIRSAVRAGSPVRPEIPVKVISSPTLLEPGVFGIFRPVLMLPEGIFDRLTAAQLGAVVEHELCHVRHRDNLAAAIHMFVETVFWFHPLVWWIGKRMVEERERGCDEEVVSVRGEARVYAEAILNVCKLYVESPLECVAGVTGSDLKKRIEGIISGRVAIRLSFAKKAALALIGMVALALPILIGTMNATVMRAQAPPPIMPPVIPMPVPQIAVRPPVPPSKTMVAEQRVTLQPTPEPSVVAPTPEPQVAAPTVFDVVSIKASDPGSRIVRADGGPGTNDPELFTCENYSLKSLVSTAYEVPYYAVIAPYWAESTQFVIRAKVPAGATKEQFYSMLRNALVERFKMVVHREKKEVQVYDLVVAKGGPKLKRSAEEVPPKVDAPGAGPKGDMSKEEFLGKDGYPKLLEGTTMAMGYGVARIMYPRQTVEWFAEMISSQVGAPVTNATGLTGKYDFAMFWSNDSGPHAAAAGVASEPRPTLFDAVQSQLGLKLEPKKGQVDIVVVDYSERVPTGN